MDYLNYSDFNSVIAFLGGGLLVIGLLVLVFVIVEIVALWKMFKKSGRNGWESIIPFYSSWVLVEIAGLNWWWVFLVIINLGFKLEIDNLTFAINLCGYLASFNCYYNIARKFGKDKTTSIFAGLFPFIFVLIFGFSEKEVYNASIPVSVNGIFGTENYDNNYNESTSIDDNKEKEYSFCVNCGAKLDKNMKFCPSCGKEKNYK